MAKYAIVNNSTNIVENVVEWNGNTSIWQPPSGMTARAVDENAETGGTWNGSAFVRKSVVNPTRTEVLMSEVTRTQKYDASLYNGTLDGDGNVTHDGMRDKTNSEISAEKTELLNLLKTDLTNGNDLSWSETQMMLRIERE